jgi:hypothetical protein
MHVRNHLFSIKAYKNMKNSIFCIAIFIVALFHNSVTLHFALGQSVSEYRPGEILLKLGPHHSIDEVLNSPISKMVGLKIKKYYRYVDIYLLEHDHYQMSSEAILPQMKSLPSILGAQLNHKIYPRSSSSTPMTHPGGCSGA